MSKKKSSSPRLSPPAHPQPPKCHPERWNGLDGLREVAMALAASSNLLFVHAGLTTGYADFWEQYNPPWKSADGRYRLVVVWQGRLDPYHVFSWRNNVINDREIAGIRFVQAPEAAPPSWPEWLAARLREAGWPVVEEAEEVSAIERGKHVEFTQAAGLAYDPGYLTLHPGGAITRVLDRLDDCKRQLREAVPWDGLNEARATVLAAAGKLVATGQTDDGRRGAAVEDSSAAMSKALAQARLAGVDRNRLPRVLLLGESGVGKTLLARYLAMNHLGAGGIEQRPFARLALPEYLHKEDDFEYAAFGYCHGAFTGARPGGNLGHLLRQIGGVVFFDEIGDTSPAIQAKLLAFLDDYCVRPRGWEGDPIYCPLLVVAATNQPIEEWLDRGGRGARPGSVSEEPIARHFRRDLLERFTAVVRVPSLEERKAAEFDRIVESLLSIESLNAGRLVESVGEHALEALRQVDYAHGNFRLLEVLFRLACQHAAACGRKQLRCGDVTAALEASNYAMRGTRCKNGASGVTPQKESTAC